MIFHRTPINYLLVNLAVADGLYATFITPEIFFRLASTHTGGMTGTVLCKLLTGGGLAWIAGTSSVVILVAIAAERYYAVIYPTGNVDRLTKRKLKVRNRQIKSEIISSSRVMVYEETCLQYVHAYD